ncbi:cobyrinate a,c-diamide synthase [Thermoflavimicrobium dichotomicum]|uniref:Cobyrinate a,c-diamide synthase n=1 Tax=Thermoflavimicrobium dichotomicum TaxID=46223 RepID=A0A1I3PLH4_9BACL|nr:cobyrinate a,c-diamide synthase [Thermoflavimicrobium dichotomicum]SFJ22209.1 cobyrinic acid a,c-diamide synthase [Thermoflavimicrobium dichotomicum]
MIFYRPRFVIAGTGSGVGKTTCTLGLMAAFRKRGLSVQGFKAGPDYIDPSYHTAVTGRPSRNLDTWMCQPERMKEIFLRGSDGADLSIIEGVMGLYDGKSPLSDQGSTAEIAILLNSPIILVVNIQSMARSAAAIVKGYQSLNPNVQIAGVIVNRAGSEGHVRLVQAAIEQECGVPVLGWLGRESDIDIPERHLGLVPAIERGELDPLFEKLAALMEERVDLARLFSIAQAAPVLSEPMDRLFVPKEKTKEPVVLAVARDAAFNFYYPENLELLEHAGAKLQFFSPLSGESVPEEADGLLIGGGFPEEFARQLTAQEEVKQSIARRIREGLPTFAECGGYMYLCRELIDRHGQAYPMVGVIPATVKMQNRLAALGYREVLAATDNILLRQGESARGHEFHYSTLTMENDDYPSAYQITGRRGVQKEGYAKGNLLAGYTHLYFPSNPAMVERWLNVCRTYRQQKGGYHA